MIFTVLILDLYFNLVLFLILSEHTNVHTLKDYFKWSDRLVIIINTTFLIIALIGWFITNFIK